MKRWSWKEAKFIVALILLICALGGCVIMLVKLAGIDPYRSHLQAVATWNKYQIDHRCTLVADETTADVNRRIYKDKNGIIRVALLGSADEKAYICSDDVIYITPL
jgi:hypothetical protein